MSVLSAREQQLFDVAKRALPEDLFIEDANAQEVLAAYAKAWAKVWDAGDDRVDKTYILNCTGADLDEHAVDRNTRRQRNEGNADLQTRLRTFDKVIDLATLRAAITAILVRDSVTIPAGYPGMVILRRDRAFFGDSALTIICGDQPTDGETLTLTDQTTTVVFEFDSNSSVGLGHVAINITGVTTTLQLAAVVLAAINASALDVTATFKPTDGSIIYVANNTPNVAVSGSETVAQPAFIVDGKSGRKRAYFDRGYRIGHSGRPHIIIVILPVGTGSDTVASIREEMRLASGAGVLTIIEVRDV